MQCKRLTLTTLAAALAAAALLSGCGGTEAYHSAIAQRDAAMLAAWQQRQAGYERAMLAAAGDPVAQVGIAAARSSERLPQLSAIRAPDSALDWLRVLLGLADSPLARRLSSGSNASPSISVGGDYTSISSTSVGGESAAADAAASSDNSITQAEEESDAENSE